MLSQDDSSSTFDIVSFDVGGTSSAHSFEREFRRNQELLYSYIFKLFLKVRSGAKMVHNIILIIIKEMVNDTLIFSEIMYTSKGRDKIFSFVQYVMDLYIKCMAHSAKFHQLVK